LHEGRVPEVAPVAQPLAVTSPCRYVAGMANERARRTAGWIGRWQTQLGLAVFWLLLGSLFIAFTPDTDEQVVHLVIGCLYLAMGVAYAVLGFVTRRKPRSLAEAPADSEPPTEDRS
jgi:hypothetical protein